MKTIQIPFFDVPGPRESFKQMRPIRGDLHANSELLGSLGDQIEEKWRSKIAMPMMIQCKEF